jgi:hypothetical protein
MSIKRRIENIDPRIARNRSIKFLVVVRHQRRERAHMQPRVLQKRTVKKLRQFVIEALGLESPFGLIQPKNVVARRMFTSTPCSLQIRSIDGYALSNYGVKRNVYRHTRSTTAVPKTFMHVLQARSVRNDSQFAMGKNGARHIHECLGPGMKGRFPSHEANRYDIGEARRELSKVRSKSAGSAQCSAASGLK